MKKFVPALCLFVLMSRSVFSFQLGLEFGVNPNLLMGANMRFSELFELKPQLGFLFKEDFSQLHLIVDGNFYLPEIMDLQHYAGLGLDLDVQSGNGGGFGLDGHYGLRYNINEIVSLFGQVGMRFDFDPFIFQSFRGGAGITIFFPNFDSYGPTGSAGSGSSSTPSYDSSGSGSFDSGTFDSGSSGSDGF